MVASMPPLQSEYILLCDLIPLIHFIFSQYLFVLSLSLRFFDRYNYCEPTCIDLNDFSAKWEFEFTDEENNYVAIL